MFKFGVRNLRRAFSVRSRMLSSKTTCNDEINLKSSHIDKDHAGADSNITEHRFVQQCGVGNCAMIAAMATLASNRDLYNKVVPSGQNFKTPSQNNATSQFAFNLYKLGKIHNVVLEFPDGILHIDEYGYYSETLLGSLLENALIHLLFDGNYEAAKSIFGLHALSSLTNNFFEHYFVDQNHKPYKNLREFTNSSLNLDEVVEHGLLTKSPMIVDFVGELSQHGLVDDHAYTLVGVQDDSVKLYDPHGETLVVQKNTFFNHVDTFQISYFNNNIFKIPVIETSLEFSDAWSALEPDEEAHFIEYDLVVEEDDTEVLVNTLVKPDSKMLTLCHIDKQSDPDFPVQVNRCSVRANLNSGTYTVTLALLAAKPHDYRDMELYSEYFEDGGSDFVFRLAASKKCSINKTEK